MTWFPAGFRHTGTACGVEPASSPAIAVTAVATRSIVLTFFIGPSSDGAGGKGGQKRPTGGWLEAWEAELHALHGRYSVSRSSLELTRTTRVHDNQDRSGQPN